MVTQEELDELLETGANQALAADRAADRPTPNRSPSSAGASDNKRSARSTNGFRGDRYTPPSDRDIDRAPRSDRDRHAHRGSRKTNDRERSGDVEWREASPRDRARRERSGESHPREIVADRRGRQNVDVEHRQFSERDLTPDSGRENRTRRGSDAPSGSGSNKDHHTANDRQRSRRRSRSPDRRRDGSRERNYRERDRQPRGDFYSGGGRAQREDDRYRPGRYDKDPRDSDRDRDARPRDNDRDGESRRDRPRYHEENDRSGSARVGRTPEPTDDERDRRTVFCQQLANRLRTRQLHEFFEKEAGPVREAQIVKDRTSGRSKGYVTASAFLHSSFTN